MGPKCSHLYFSKDLTAKTSLRFETGWRGWEVNLIKTFIYLIKDLYLKKRYTSIFMTTLWNSIDDGHAPFGFGSLTSPSHLRFHAWGAICSLLHVCLEGEGHIAMVPTDSFAPVFPSPWTDFGRPNLSYSKKKKLHSIAYSTICNSWSIPLYLILFYTILHY